MVGEYLPDPAISISDSIAKDVSVISYISDSIAKGVTVISYLLYKDSNWKHPLFSYHF